MTADGDQSQTAMTDVSTQATDQAPDGAKVFTQEDLDRLIGRARMDERSKYPGYEENKAKLAELETANLTESERKDQQIAELQRTGADAEERIATALIGAEIQTKAAQMGIIDPGAALALINRTGISHSEADGVVGVDDALDLLISDKPYLKGAPKAANLNPGGEKTAVVTSLTPNEREAAHRLFYNLPPAEAEAAYAKGKTT